MTARVLVVDDILSNVKLLEAKLTAEYFEVTAAYNGLECLARMDADPEADSATSFSVPPLGRSRKPLAGCEASSVRQHRACEAVPRMLDDSWPRLGRQRA